MIVKFLEPSANFRGVFYNTDKVAEGKAELMQAVNFGALQAMNEISPKDYWHYLKALSARNKGISEPQLHVAISTTGTTHDKHELTRIAKAWLEKMGYGAQPYLIYFHKDTGNNHVHIVSTRVDHEGRKISSAFEHVRAVKVLNQVMGLDVDETVKKDLEKARAYRFTTISQFKLILEKQGYTIKDNDLIKFGTKLAALDFGKVEFRDPDPRRSVQLKAIFKKYALQYDPAGFTEYMKTKMGVELVFHAKDGKPVYGYTVIDHAQKNVYKGSQVMPLKELHEQQRSTTAPAKTSMQQYHQISQKTNEYPKTYSQPFQQISQKEQDTSICIHISGDIDDEAIHGRRRKKKSRTNHR